MSFVLTVSRKARRALPDLLTESVKTGSFPGWTLDLPDLDAKATVESVKDHLREACKLEERGALLTWDTRTTRRLGSQSWPIRLTVGDLSTLGRLVDEASLGHFLSLSRCVLAREPSLRSFWESDPLGAWGLRGQWSSLCRALQWFRHHPRSGWHRRALPWDLHGKFVEENERILDVLLSHSLPDQLDPTSRDFEGRWGLARREPLWRGRILDEGLRATLGLCADDLAMSLRAWSSRPRPESVLVVENLESLLSLGPRAHTLAIWGRGWAVLELADWLSQMDQVIYWGDLDAQGFEILDALRPRIERVKSVAMDNATFTLWRKLACPGTPAGSKELQHLNQGEWLAYRQVVGQNLRLEQEKIPLIWVEEKLDQAFSAVDRA